LGVVPGAFGAIMSDHFGAQSVAFVADEDERPGHKPPDRTPRKRSFVLECRTFAAADTLAT
jgi:hypothetical protein